MKTPTVRDYQIDRDSKTGHSMLKFPCPHCKTAITTNYQGPEHLYKCATCKEVFFVSHDRLVALIKRGTAVQEGIARPSTTPPETCVIPVNKRILKRDSESRADRIAWIAAAAVTAVGAAVIIGYQSYRSPKDTASHSLQHNTASTQQDFAQSTGNDSVGLHGTCVECGRQTDNPPDAVGEVLCSTCLAYYREKNLQFIENYNAGTATKCEWCGGYAAEGNGVCDSCMRRIVEEMRRME